MGHSHGVNEVAVGNVRIVLHAADLHEVCFVHVQHNTGRRAVFTSGVTRTARGTLCQINDSSVLTKNTFLTQSTEVYCKTNAFC